MGIIRLLLAMAVFNSHFPFVDLPIVDGHEAVLSFFAISGFYMALILDTSYSTANQFYASRFLTLYPMYIFALAISVALVVTRDIHPMTARAELQMLLTDPVSFLVMMWTSLCILGQELLFSLAQSPNGGLSVVTDSRTAIWNHAPLIQAWSLSLEITFYALAPFLVRLKTRTLISLVIASLCGKLFVITGSMVDTVFFKRFFLTEFWLFGCGILAYRTFKRLPQKARGIDYAFFAALIATIVIVGVAPESIKPFALPVATLISIPLVFRGFRQFELDRIIGKISYPFYLLHFSIIAIFEMYLDEPIGWHILLVALAAAILAYSLFEPGTELLKRRMRGNQEKSFIDKKVASPYSSQSVSSASNT